MTLRLIPGPPEPRRPDVRVELLAASDELLSTAARGEVVELTPTALRAIGLRCRRLADTVVAGGARSLSPISGGYRDA